MASDSFRIAGRLLAHIPETLTSLELRWLAARAARPGQCAKGVCLRLVGVEIFRIEHSAAHFGRAVDDHRVPERDPGMLMDANRARRVVCSTSVRAWSRFAPGESSSAYRQICASTNRRLPLMDAVTAPADVPASAEIRSLAQPAKAPVTGAGVAGLLLDQLCCSRRRSDRAVPFVGKCRTS